jgi:hypothetical protein
MQIILTRDHANIPWGFRLKGGAEYNVPLSILKVRLFIIIDICFAFKILSKMAVLFKNVNPNYQENFQKTLMFVNEFNLI